MPKLCPRLILEGTRLTHKTDLAFAMVEHPRFVGPRKYKYHTPLVSAEWGGLTDKPWGESLITFGPENQGPALAAFNAWCTLFESLRHEAWIVDRFHLSARTQQAAQGGLTPEIDRALDTIDARCARAGFTLVLCTRADNTFDAARHERLKVSGNPSQYDDLDIFLQEQATLRTLAAGSRLPVIELDVTGVGIDDACDAIADRLGLP